MLSKALGTLKSVISILRETYSSFIANESPFPDMNQARDTKVNLSSRIWRNTYISKHRFLETNGSGFRLLFTCQYWDFSAVMSIDPYLISEELLERDQPWVTNNEHPIFYSYTCIKTVEPKVQ